MINSNAFFKLHQYRFLNLFFLETNRRSIKKSIKFILWKKKWLTTRWIRFFEKAISVFCCNQRIEIPMQRVVNIRCRLSKISSSHIMLHRSEITVWTLRIKLCKSHYLVANKAWCCWCISTWYYRSTLSLNLKCIGSQTKDAVQIKMKMTREWVPTSVYIAPFPTTFYILVYFRLRFVLPTECE